VYVLRLINIVVVVVVVVVVVDFTSRRVLRCRKQEIGLRFCCGFDTATYAISDLPRAAPWSKIRAASY